MLQLIFLILPFISFHDIAAANFEIRQTENLLTLQIKMDKEDLEKLYPKKEKGTVDLTKENDFIQKYLTEHFYLVVNNEKINFDLQQVSKDPYFYRMELISQNKINQTIRHIQLKNTCLIDQVDRHSNIVNFKINEKLRTFRLHKGRTQIEVKY